jgi:hypothetical protein
MYNYECIDIITIWLYISVHVTKNMYRKQPAENSSLSSVSVSTRSRRIRATSKTSSKIWGYDAETVDLAVDLRGVG